MAKGCQPGQYSQARPRRRVLSFKDPISHLKKNRAQVKARHQDYNSSIVTHGMQGVAHDNTNCKFS